MDGTLSIYNGESRVNGTLIIKRGSTVSPPAAATSSFQSLGFDSGSKVKVAGTDDSWKGEYALNMSSASSQ